MIITCPRRLQEVGSWEYKENLDEWRRRDGFQRCSFCGSMNPDEFLQAMLDGCELGPTDKNYKVYVQIAGKREGKFYF